MAPHSESSRLGTRSRLRPYDVPNRQSRRQPSSTQNPVFFQGARNTDASHGIFNDVVGDQYNIHVHHSDVARSEMEENAILDKLPYAIGAGHTAGNHKPCLQGTRTAVLAEIERWEVDANDTFVYWLKGVAGCGKSTIAQTFAERSSASGRLCVSFICSRNFDDRRDLHLIFPTLALYLAYQHPSFRAALVPVILSNPHIRHDSLAVQFEKLIIGPLKSTELRPTIIIDALDECKDEEPVSQFLSALAQHLHEIPFVKIFITGRPEDHIRSGFAIPSLRTKELPLHDVDSATVDTDIELYVRTRLQDIVERQNGCIRGPWPSEEDVAAIIRKCSGFFIIASVIIGFIDDRYELPQDRLDMIVQMQNGTIYEGMSRMDVAYYQILIASFRGIEEGDSKPYDDFRLVVAPIVVAFNPLSCASLARISGVPSERISKTLSHLHSVLIVPNSDTEPIRVCHKSFADFLTDAERCRDPRLHVDAPAHHFDVGVRCWNLMNVTLKRNICDFPKYAMNDEIEDLLARREKYIGAALAYACEFWVDHLRLSAGFDGGTDTIVGLIDPFFKNHFLSWLEVLSIRGNLRVAVLSMSNVKSWLTCSTTWKPGSSLMNFVDDCERFVLQFFSIIEKSATHIYHSALAWSPTSSATRNMYQMHLTTEAKLVNAVDTNWDAHLKTIPFRRDLHLRGMAFSHDGTSLAVASYDNVTILDTMRGGTISVVQSCLADSITFSPDDNMFACFGVWSDSVRIWNVQRSDLVQEFVGHADIITSVAFSPSGTMIASGSYDKTVRICNLSSGSCQCVLEGDSEVLAVCWSVTGEQVISESKDGTTRVWDLSQQTCSMIPHEHIAQVTCAASFPGSSLAAFASEDGTVKVCDSRSGGVIRTISIKNSPKSIQFSNHGGDLKMMCTNFASATIWDLNRDMHVSTITCHAGYHTAISLDGTLVASTHVATAGGSEVKIWSTANSHSSSETVNGGDLPPVSRVSFAPDGQLVVSESSGDVKVWDVTLNKCLLTFPFYLPSPSAFTFSPDSAFFVCRPYDYRSKGTSKVQLLNINTRSLVDVYGDVLPDSALALSPGGSTMVSLSDSQMTLWNLDNCKRLASLDVSTLSSLSSRISFSVDGTKVFVKGDGVNNTQIWRISQAQPPDCSSSSESDEPTSLPMVFLPVQEGSHQDGLDIFESKQRCRFRNWNEWILDEDGRRMLWIPPDRKSLASDFYDKKVAVGTYKGRVYVADFSDALSSG